MKTILFPVKGWLKVATLILSVLFVVGCSNSQIKKEFSRLEKGKIFSKGIKMEYPLDGTIFPPEIPSPRFEWKDSIAGSSEWSVFISDNRGNVLITSTCDEESWRPDSTEWGKIKKLPAPMDYVFTVIAPKGNNNFYPTSRIRFSISSDPVGADIFYRAVTLPFSYAVKNVNTIEWYMGSVKGSKPRKMLDNLPVCGNCHSFSREQPLLAMDVDYGSDKGSYVIAPIKDSCELRPKDIITWSDYKREDEELTLGLLSQISPDGNYVLSTVKDLSIFVAIDNNMAYSQLFFPIKGIIGIFDRRNRSFDALNGANDSRYVQSNPTWSPDGKKVLFAKTDAYINEKVKKAGRAMLSLDDVAEFKSGNKPFKYDLYTVDFNNGKGGVSTPLPGASNNGKSNYFPKFSPDGKWIVFCQADNFMLLQRDSRLYIMPSGGGEPRLMNCNMSEMNSWHSWSPNGRWMVFSSKSRGLYTQLYLTHIDENGMDSPPVLLENLCFDKRAANIPEFYPFEGDHFMKIEDGFSKTAEYYNRGAFDKMTNKYYKRALEDLERALEVDGNNLEAYFNRIMLNNILQQPNSMTDLADKKKAMKLILDFLSKNPGDENYISSKISLLSNMGKEEEALQEARLAMAKYPNNYKLYDLLSSIYRKENQFEKAIECYQKMLKIDPKKKAVLNNLIAGAFMKLNQTDRALQLINQSIGEQPNDYDLLYTRGQILLQQKSNDLAKKDIDKMMLKDSTNYQYNLLLTQYYFNQGNKRLYYFQKMKSLQILNELFEKNREDVTVIFEIASIYMSLKDFQNAEKHYDFILTNFPVNYEALKQKAKIKLNLQQWNDAISIYDQLEANYLPEEGFCNNKAIAYIKIGNYSKALEYFDKTIKINPNNQDAIFNRNKLRSEKVNYK